MDFNEALEYLDSFANYEKRTKYDYVKDLGLERVRALLGLLGNPQTAFKSIVIAGTNGKGTSAAVLSSLLCAAGKRTGLYTSPHLVSICERVQIDQCMVSETLFAESVALVSAVLEAEWDTERLGSLTYFEILTAVAFLVFAKERVDYAVLEIGLGGRLDAVNVADPELSLITPIDYDHQHILGNDILQIAGEKAGVIRPNSFLISGRQQNDVVNMLQGHADNLNTKSSFLGIDFDYDSINMLSDGIEFVYDSEEFFVPFLAAYQVDNVLLAVNAIRALLPDIASADIQKGLAVVKWPGRFERIIIDGVDVILDGAHNAHAANSLVCEVKKKYAERKVVVLFSSAADKDYASVLKELAALCCDIFLTEISSVRRASVDNMMGFAGADFSAAKAVKDLKDAFGLSLQSARKDGAVLLICGSLFLVGEIKKIIGELYT